MKFHELIKNVLSITSWTKVVLHKLPPPCLLTFRSRCFPLVISTQITPSHSVSSSSKQILDSNTIHSIGTHAHGIFGGFSTKMSSSCHATSRSERSKQTRRYLVAIDLLWKIKEIGTYHEIRKNKDMMGFFMSIYLCTIRGQPTHYG